MSRTPKQDEFSAFQMWLTSTVTVSTSRTYKSLVKSVHEYLVSCPSQPFGQEEVDGYFNALYEKKHAAYFITKRAWALYVQWEQEVNSKALPLPTQREPKVRALRAPKAPKAPSRKKISSEKEAIAFLQEAVQEAQGELIMVMRFPDGKINIFNSVEELEKLKGECREAKAQVNTQVREQTLVVLQGSLATMS